MSGPPANFTRSQSDEGMTRPGSSRHDPAPTANSVQLHADPQEIYIIDSKDDEPMTVDTEEIEVIDIAIDEDDDIIEGEDLIQL